MEKKHYKILKTITGETYNLPIFLECTADEMGGMVGFDGDIEQVEQICNFHYEYLTGNSIRLYNTVNSDSLKSITNETFVIKWGDNTTDNINVNPVGNLEYIDHTYLTNNTYTISIELLTSWTNKKVSKKVTVPKNDTITNQDGSFGPFTIPYTNTTTTIEYINDLDITDNDSDAVVHFAGVGRSRVSELKKYGESSYQGITTGSDSVGNFTGYTIDNLLYKDYDDGITTISGSTTNFYSEEVFNEMLTRNEHFIGFIDEPTIYSDVFVERGKQGVLEMNLRLGEIDNVGELDIYGNGFFRVKKE